MKEHAKFRVKDITLIVLLALMMFIAVVPVIWTILNAFKDNFDIMNNPFSLPKSFSLENVMGAWRLAKFNVTIVNTLFTSFMIVLLVVIVACPTAYALSKLKFKLRYVLFYTLFLGLSIPNQTIIISVFYRMKAMGLINSLWGYILLMIGTNMPFAIFMMRNTYMDLPSELRESARIDGASEWRTFLSIYFPLGKSGIMALAVFTFIGAWNEYLYPLVLLINPEKQVVSTAVVAFQASMKSNYSYVFGAALISLVPSLVVYLLLQRSFVQGAAAGATKG